MAAYWELIQNNIEYPCLCAQYRTERVDEIVELILDSVCSQKPYLRVGGDDKPREVVKSRLLKLNQFSVEYVFECLDKNATKVRNIKVYLLTTLYPVYCLSDGSVVIYT